MYGTPPLTYGTAPLTPSAGRRSRIGLVLWFAVQWVLVPLDLMARLLYVPVFVVIEVATDLEWPDRGWLRMLLRPLTRFVGPVRLVREWGDGERLWDARMAAICRTAAAAYARRPAGKQELDGWAGLRWGSEMSAFLLSPKDYRGVRPERIHAIAAEHGLTARSAGEFGVELAPVAPVAAWNRTVAR
ncbi:hypothetical protein [Kitasatospora sp. NPDC048407]|uniref:hypothetical protein n=1 Tax=Kitasatospora sp. NPDC048407 TaxID=3364051 RepID=UPI00370FDED4